MSRAITLDEALALLDVQPANPESDDPREHEPHALWQCEPYPLAMARLKLGRCVNSGTARPGTWQNGRIEVGVDPDGQRRVTGSCSMSSTSGATVSVYRLDARPFTDAELIAGVFALLSGDRARAVDPTVLDGDAARVICIRAESFCGGWMVSVLRLHSGDPCDRLWFARGVTLGAATDNLRAILSANYGVPND